jgi:hypothetical protein
VCADLVAGYCRQNRTKTDYFSLSEGDERQLSLNAGSSRAVGYTKSQPRASVEEIADGLQRVLRSGVRPAQLRQCGALLVLRCVRARADGSGDVDRLAFGLEDVLRAALDALGDGPHGRAAELLFGAVVDTVGRPLKVRRRLAAEQLDIMASTFRQNYEDQLLLDVAAEVYRLELVVSRG